LREYASNGPLGIGKVDDCFSIVPPPLGTTVALAQESAMTGRTARCDVVEQRKATALSLPEKSLKEAPIEGQAGVFGVMAIHEKAGRSQVDSVVALWNMFLSLPSGHCRHASIRTLKERFVFARCMLGVLVTAGAAI
jgi:hypothetical protein